MRFHVAFVLTLATFACAEWTSNDPFVGQSYLSIAQPRGLFVDAAGDVLVLARAQGVEAVYEEDNGDGTINVVSVRIVNGAGLGLNHGVTVRNGYLYASSPTTVYRWPYTPGQRTEITAQPETVITGMPEGGDHITRTLVFDEEERLYIGVGSYKNVDIDSERSKLWRFTLTGNLPISIGEGEIFADGLRNEVGLAFDPSGTLWGVENGADLLVRDDLGGPIFNGNPAEEMNRFNGSVGQHYGYPYCFSTHNLPGYEKGTQFAWPTYLDNGTHTDEWCRDTANNMPPAFPMPAHNAPLGIEFYRGQNCDGSDGAFPCSATGDAVVAFHGSWNSDVAVGYRVGWFPMDKVTGDPLGEDINILYDPNGYECSGPCFRPVNAVFNDNGHLIVSDDSSNTLVKVTYGSQPKPIKAHFSR